ncbi:MAG: hypothetical protein ACR2LU_02885 [Luteitalea sp.]
MPPLRPLIAAVLLLGAASGASPGWAQQPAAPSRPSGPDLDRIRRQFVHSGDSLFLGPIRSDYKVLVEEHPDDLDYRFGWLYDQTTITPGHVRPWYPIYHYEMQSMMIPQEFRAHLYPTGVPAGNALGAIKGAFRARQSRVAKAKVAAEVKVIEQQARERKDP